MATLDEVVEQLLSTPPNFGGMSFDKVCEVVDAYRKELSLRIVRAVMVWLEQNYNDIYVSAPNALTFQYKLGGSTVLQLCYYNSNDNIGVIKHLNVDASGALHGYYNVTVEDFNNLCQQTYGADVTDVNTQFNLEFSW